MMSRITHSWSKKLKLGKRSKKSRQGRAKRKVEAVQEQWWYPTMKETTSVSSQVSNIGKAKSRTLPEWNCATRNRGEAKQGEAGMREAGTREMGKRETWNRAEVVE